MVLTWHGDEPLFEMSSLVSAGIVDALKQGATSRVHELTLAGDTLDLEAIPEGAVVFPVAVGSASSGLLQELLEVAGIPFVGSGSRALRATYDERVWRPRLSEAGIPVAPYIVCEHDDDLLEVVARAVQSFPGGCVLRPYLRDAMPPRFGGASRSEVHASLKAMLSSAERAVLEANRPAGRRFFLACLRLDARPHSLPVVEVIESANAGPPRAFWSLWDTEYVCPAALDWQQCAALGDIAVAAHDALGCVTSLIEVHCGNSGDLAVCACDAAPLLLPSGLFALAAGGGGVLFGELVRRLVDDAR